MGRSRRDTSSSPEWGATVSSRIAWLAKTKFADSRSALAKAIGFSHTIVTEVAKGRSPGPRLLEAIVNRLQVRREWLEAGDGKPYIGDANSDLGIAVTNVLLPGPPLSHPTLVTDRITVPEVVPSASAYWLVLKSSQAVVKKPSSGFRTGDQLLMETDPAKFPKETELGNDLCVVRGGAGGTELRLATVRHYKASMDSGPARLEADYHDTAKHGSEDQTVVEVVYRHHPGGEVEHFERRYPRVPGRGDRPGMEPDLPVIRYMDIVSVWLKILRRPFG